MRLRNPIPEINFERRTTLILVGLFHMQVRVGMSSLAPHDDSIELPSNFNFCQILMFLGFLL